MFKRKILILAAIMLIFSMISLGIIRAYGRKPLEVSAEDEVFVTSFYPVHLLTQRLVEGAKGVQLIHLTENHVGCLHDYQLTTKDMLTLEQADILVINGGDMELFVTSATAGCADLVIVDASEGMSFLEGTEHNHDHESEEEHEHESEEEHEHESEEEHEHESEAEHEHESEAEHEHESEEEHEHESEAEHEHESEAEHEHESEEEHEHESEEEHEHESEAEHDHAAESEAAHIHAVNGHVWLNTERYMQQLYNIKEALCRFDTANASLYQQNYENYTVELQTFAEEYHANLADLRGSEVVVFHDAFFYLCEELGMEVIHGVSLDADTALSAAEIAEVTDEIRLHEIKYLLAEEVTGAVAEQIAAETGCQVIYLNPLTSGESTAEAYLEAMRSNMESLAAMLR